MRANYGPFKALLLMGLLQIGLAGSLSAQVIFRKHTPEAGVFMGASYGVDKARVMGGGNFVYSLTDLIMPFGEISYFPGIGRTATVSGIAGATSTFTLPITDFNAGLHVRIPIPKSRVIPYGVISAGLIHNSAHTEQITYPDQLNPGKFVTTPFPVPAETHYATSAGAGLRLYATEHVGFRGEFKAYIPNGNLDKFYRVTAGFFYQF